jgi:hypothetical protein
VYIFARFQISWTAPEKSNLFLFFLSFDSFSIIGTTTRALYTLALDSRGVVLAAKIFPLFFLIWKHNRWISHTNFDIGKNYVIYQKSRPPPKWKKKKKKLFSVIFFPLRSPDWPGPSFRRNLWCQKFLPRFFIIWKKKKKKKLLLLFFEASRLFVMPWNRKQKCNHFCFFVSLSCPEDGIIDRISRSSGGRVWDQHTHTHTQFRALNAELKQDKKKN